MGKKLIIKNADFSTNAVETRVIKWYITSYTDFGSGATTSPNVVNGGWAYFSAYNSLIQGKTINALKFKAYGTGTFNLYVGTLDSTSTTLIGSLNITSSESGQVVTKTFTPYTMGSNEYLIFGEPNTAAAFYYRTSISPTSSNNNFYTQVPSHWWSSTSGTIQMCIDVGYIEPD